MLGLVFFLLFCFFLFRDQVFWNQNTDFFSRPNFQKPRLFLRQNSSKPRLFSETKFSETETFFLETKFSKKESEIFFCEQILRNPNYQKIGKSLESEKFRNRNANLWLKRLKRRGIEENFPSLCQREELYSLFLNHPHLQTLDVNLYSFFTEKVGLLNC